ncbi:MAG: DUF2141 domain-containing protein [Algicola sp.]|nr:DUF2141 domain-containing protein [Algicola sp.]
MKKIMKRHHKILPALLPALMGLMATAQGASAAEVIVNVTNINQHQGTVYVVLFDSANAFDKKKGKALTQSKIKASKDSHSLVFSELKPGSYAVKLFHDENNNGKFDKNFFGIPSEGYGFSNNGGAFGAPDFKDASFVVTDSNREISIKLR